MTKSVFSPAYKSLLETLVAIRKEQRVSQVELARRLGRTQQFVSNYETGVRRLDVVEFYEVMTALEVDPVDSFRKTVAGFKDHNG